MAARGAHGAAEQDKDRFGGQTSPYQIQDLRGREKQNENREARLTQLPISEIILCMALVCAFPNAGMTQASPARLRESADVPSFDTRGQKVKRIKTLIHTRGGRVDWSSKRNLIAFCMKGTDGYSDLWTMKEDGSEKKCLTSDKPALPQKHNGQPAWHPSGEYIAFQAQNPRLRGPDYLSTVGRGIHNDLWLTTPDGGKFWPFTTVRQDMGVLHPHFSPDGKKLIWAERIGGGKGWGDWCIMTADFVADERGPRLENRKSLHPGGKDTTFYETHGFSPDGRRIVFTADIGRTICYSMDIWQMDLASGQLAQLTDTEGTWDEHARYWPDGGKLIWSSSQGYPFPEHPTDNWGAWLTTDYWTMAPDGSNKERMTFFNDPGAPEYVGKGGRVIVADLSFSPDGAAAVAALAIVFKDGRAAQSIVRLDF